MLGVCGLPLEFLLFPDRLGQVGVSPTRNPIFDFADKITTFF